MTFLHPEWFWLLLIPALIVSGGVRERKTRWLLAAIFGIVVALARPVLPQQMVERQEPGGDVIFAVDLSWSMRGDDLPPSRLVAAKTLLADVVRRDTRDRFGVLGFTTNAVILSPLTGDAALLLSLFDRLDETLIMTKGTDVRSALELAAKMSHAQTRNVILLTDGGDENDYADAAAFARQHKLRITVVMLATRTGAMLRARSGDPIRDETGGLVISARNDAIRELSDATGGAFIDGADAASLLDTLETQREADFSAIHQEVGYQELFYYFVLFALAAFMLAATTVEAVLRRKIGALLLMFGLSAQAGLLDFYTLRLAEEAYHKGAYERAAGLYARVSAPPASRFNAAVSLYKAGKYEKALETFKGVLSADAPFKAAVFYNMGSCYVQLERYDQAREALKKSLTLRFDPDALDNLIAITEKDKPEGLPPEKGKKPMHQAAKKSDGPQTKIDKGAGGANLNVTADAGGGDGGKQSRTEATFNTSEHKAPLGSRVYELINRSSVRETKPW